MKIMPYVAKAATTATLAATALLLSIGSTVAVESVIKGPGLETASQFFMASKAIGAAQLLQQRNTIFSPGVKNRLDHMEARLNSLQSPFFAPLRYEGFREAADGKWTEKKIVGYLDAAELSSADLNFFKSAAQAEKAGPVDDDLIWHATVETRRYEPQAPVVEAIVTLTQIELATSHVLEMKPIESGHWNWNLHNVMNTSPVVVAAASIGLTDQADPMESPEFGRAPKDPLASISAKADNADTGPSGP